MVVLLFALALMIVYVVAAELVRRTCQRKLTAPVRMTEPMVERAPVLARVEP